MTRPSKKLHESPMDPSFWDWMNNPGYSGFLAGACGSEGSLVTTMEELFSDESSPNKDLQPPHTL